MGLTLPLPLTPSNSVTGLKEGQCWESSLDDASHTTEWAEETYNHEYTVEGRCCYVLFGEEKTVKTCNALSMDLNGSVRSDHQNV